MTPVAESATPLQKLVRTSMRPVCLPERERAARHLLDWLGCAAAAFSLPAARQFQAALQTDRSPEPILLLTEPTEVHQAVLADGALGSLLEMDDVHRNAVLHPGPVIIPAALATAIHSQASIDALLDAIVRGYEVAIRLGRAVGLGHYRYWHPTSTCGAFGAAMAAGSLRGLDAPGLAWALANAGTRTGGLWQMRHEPVPSKALHTALAAHSGWLAAALAQQGFRGPLSLLEGSQGLFAAMAPGADPAVLSSDSDQWLIHEVSFKPWPACRHAHPAMDALLALQCLPEPDSIDSVTVETYQAALDFCDCPQPSTPGEARFSIQHALASIILHGRPRMRHYDPEAIEGAAVRNLRSRIRLTTHSRFNDVFPSHFGAAVFIQTRSGEQLRAAVADAWGDPEWPLTDTDLAAKAADLFEHAGFQAARARRIIEQTLGLAEQGDQPAMAILRACWS